MIKRLVMTMLMLLALALAMGAYAEGIGDHKKEAKFIEDEGGSGVKGLADPPPSGFTVLYIFSGARDTQNSITNSAATSVTCSNAGSTSVEVMVEISDWDNNPTIFGTLTILPSGTKTFSTQPTLFYSDDFIMVTSDDINQGSGRVLANSSSANIICTAQVLDPLGNPPEFMINLNLFKP